METIFFRLKSWIKFKKRTTFKIYFSPFKQHFRQTGGTLNPYASGAFKGNQTFDGGAKGGGAGGAGRDRADRLVID